MPGPFRLAALLVVIALLGVACAPGGRWGNRRGDLPPIRDPLLVVSANLDEVYDQKDLADLSDVDRFLSRLLATVTGDPDAVLLQEVGRPAASRVVRLLRKETGEAYRMVVAPGRDTWVRRGSRIRVRETAILVRSKRLRSTRGGRFFLGYARRHAASSEPVKEKDVSYARVLDRQSGRSLALASVHMVRSSTLASPEVSHGLKARWATSIAKRAQRLARHVLIGGDFNEVQCMNRSMWACEEPPFWEVLDRGHGLKDARRVYRSAVRGDRLPARSGVDHFFTNADVGEAASDHAYDAALRADPRHFYSDHQFRWVVIGLPGTG